MGIVCVWCWLEFLYLIIKIGTKRLQSEILCRNGEWMCVSIKSRDIKQVAGRWSVLASNWTTPSIMPRLLVLNNVIWFAFLILLFLFLIVEIMMVLFSWKENGLHILIEQFGCIVPRFSCNLTIGNSMESETTKISPHSILMSLIAVLNASFNYLNSQLAENKLKR